MERFLRSPFTWSVGSACLLTLSFPGWDLAWLAWFAFIPLLRALEGQRPARAFALAYCCGLVYWLASIYWLVHVTGPGTIVLCAYLALYFAVFGLAASRPWTRRLGAFRLFFVPAVWVALECLRNWLFTGFGWALVGYSQYRNPLVIQFADITGAWGVSFLVVWTNICLLEALTQWKPGGPGTGLPHKTTRGLIAMIVCVWAGVLGYGFWKLGSVPAAADAPRIRVAVVQGNIPQELKWKAQARDYIMDTYLRLSAESLSDAPDLVAWPEAALPVILEEEPAYAARIAEFLKTTDAGLLLGAVTFQDPQYYNSAILLRSPDRLFQEYHKVHLVPFGEYIPLRRVLPFLETIVPIGEVSRGTDYTIFELPLRRDTQRRVARFGVLICFEDVFPDSARTFVRKGAQFLVNITNDAWYQRTAASFQHLQASVFRAVENRVCVIRAANTGISGFIDSRGRTASLVQDKTGRQIFVQGTRSREIVLTQGETSFYSRYGDVFPAFCLALIGLGGIIARARSRRVTAAL